MINQEELDELEEWRTEVEMYRSTSNFRNVPEYNCCDNCKYEELGESLTNEDETGKVCNFKCMYHEVFYDTICDNYFRK